MLISHVLRYLPAQVLAPVAQLASVVLWTHWLAPAQMGVFTLVMAAQEMACAICLGWFSVYALRHMPPPDDAPAMRRYLGTENSVVLGGIAGSVLAGLVVALTLPLAQEPGPLWLHALAIGAHFATRAVSTHYAERARAQSRFLAYTLLQTTGPVGAIVLGLLVFRHAGGGADAAFGAASVAASDAFTLLWCYTAAQTAGCLLALPLLQMDWRRLRPDRTTLRAALAFGAPLFGIGLLAWVAENYHRYLVQWGLGEAALGLMIVGWSLGRRGATVAAGLVVAAAFPLAARLINLGRRDEALQHLQLNATLVLAVLAPLTVGVAFLGPGLLSLVVAPEYRAASASVLGWAMLGAALRNLHQHTTDQVMVLERRWRMVVNVSLVEIAACVAASLLGWAGWGLQGALVGQAAGSAFTLALSMRWARRQLGFAWPWDNTLRIAAASAPMAVALWWLDSPAHLAGLARGCAVGAATYLLFLGLLVLPQWWPQRPWLRRGAR